MTSLLVEANPSLLSTRTELSETLNDLYERDPHSHDIIIAIMNRITAIEKRMAAIEVIFARAHVEGKL